jgi:hypothetical protein
MTDVSLPAGRFTESDFRVGHVFSQTWQVFSRNFLRFGVITGIASLPPFLIPQTAPDPANPFANLGWALVALFLMIVLGTLSQAIVLYGAFQDMRGRPVSLGDCLQVGLGRFFPIVGLAISMGLAVMFASMLFIIPGLILYMMWIVATPACVVERLGPFRSMGRSRVLTKGHRWKILGLFLLTLIPVAIIGALIGALVVAVLGVTGLAGGFSAGLFGVTAALGTTLGHLVTLIWSAIWKAFYAVLAVVIYHDLRVAKEGVDTEQIAAVFE